MAAVKQLLDVGELPDERMRIETGRRDERTIAELVVERWKPWRGICND